MNEYSSGTADTDSGLSDYSSDEKETNQVSSEDSLDWAREADEQGFEGGKKVSIDWTELEGALENNSPDLHSFFNKQTGVVIRIFSGHEGADRKLRDVEADPSYIYIEPISSREQYRWMEEFIEEMEESPLRKSLEVAIDGRGAFRRFKDALTGDTGYREKWFEKRSGKIYAHIQEWLKAKGIAPANPSPSEKGATTRKFETVRRNRYNASGSRAQGTSLRRVAHELVDQIPSGELSGVVDFLEFLDRKYNSTREG